MVEMMENDFPNEINLVIKALDNKHRRQIILEIDENGPQSYTMLTEKVIPKKGSLTYHLKTLLKSGIVKNYLNKNGEDHYSYYDITLFGRKIINSIFNAFEPEEIVTIDQTSANEWKSDPDSISQFKALFEDYISPTSSIFVNRDYPDPREIKKLEQWR